MQNYSLALPYKIKIKQKYPASKISRVLKAKMIRFIGRDTSSVNL